MWAANWSPILLIMKNYKCLHFEEIDSTNSYIKDNYQNLDDFTFVSTSFQRKGRGRNDHIWLSQKNVNLMFSLLLKGEHASLGGLLSIITAFSIAKVLEEKYELNKAEIKWPNDIYVDDKKICGILLEGELPNYVIIGVGLNVNQVEFTGEYRKTPTSIRLEKKEEIDIKTLKEAVYDALFENITKNNGYLEYYRKHDYLKGKYVKVKQNNNYVEGYVLGVDDNFNLMIEKEKEIFYISSGEIEVIK